MDVINLCMFFETNSLLLHYQILEKLVTLIILVINGKSIDLGYSLRLVDTQTLVDSLSHLLHSFILGFLDGWH